MKPGVYYIPRLDEIIIWIHVVEHFYFCDADQNADDFDFQNTEAVYLGGFE